jgi:hypothetical protein
MDAVLHLVSLWCFGYADRFYFAGGFRTVSSSWSQRGRVQRPGETAVKRARGTVIWE